jgi:hypothetical protein
LEGKRYFEQKKRNKKLANKKHDCYMYESDDPDGADILFCPSTNWLNKENDAAPEQWERALLD